MPGVNNQVNNNAARQPWFGAVVFGWFAYLYNMVVNYIHSSTERLSHIGNELVANARQDLANLRIQLDRLWNISQEDRQTIVLLTAAILGKLGYTPIITILTLLSAGVKLSLGGACMLLGGELFNFVRQFLNILRNFVVEGFEIVAQYLGDFLHIARRAFITFVNEVGRICARISAAIARNVEWLIRNLDAIFGHIIRLVSDVVHLIVDGLEVICRNLARLVNHVVHFIVDGLQALFNNLLRIMDHFFHAFEQILDFLVNTISDAAFRLLLSAGNLVFGVVKAGYLTTKGVVLSIAAMIVETPVITGLSGAAKSIFILDEALFAAIGALIDGAVGSIKGLAGYNRLPMQTIDLVGTTTTEASYYSHAGRDGMHALNVSLLQAGNSMLSRYQAEKASIIGNNGWEVEHEPAPVAANTQPAARARRR